MAAESSAEEVATERAVDGDAALASDAGEGGPFASVFFRVARARTAARRRPSKDRAPFLF